MKPEVEAFPVEPLAERLMVLFLVGSPVPYEATHWALAPHQVWFPDFFLAGELRWVCWASRDSSFATIHVALRSREKMLPVFVLLYIPCPYGLIYSI